MRKRKVIVITTLALLGAGVAMFLLTRDSGPPVVVKGNFSAKDVTQIKSAARKELWREAFPDFSSYTIKALPRRTKRALTTRVSEIESLDWASVGSSNEAFASLVAGTNYVGNYVFTNDPTGWRLNPHVRIIY